MQDNDRQLLQQIHTAVGRIEGAMPHMATKTDITAHERDYHGAPRPSIMTRPGARYAVPSAIVTALTALVYAILQACDVL